jgi:hypothetical protein
LEGLVIQQQHHRVMDGFYARLYKSMRARERAAGYQTSTGGGENWRGLPPEGGSVLSLPHLFHQQSSIPIYLLDLLISLHR